MRNTTSLWELKLYFLIRFFVSITLKFYYIYYYFMAQLIVTYIYFCSCLFPDVLCSCCWGEASGWQPSAEQRRTAGGDVSTLKNYNSPPALNYTPIFHFLTCCTFTYSNQTLVYFQLPSYLTLACIHLASSTITTCEWLN